MLSFIKKAFFLYSAVLLAWIERISFFGFRWQSCRTGCGPQTGAERVSRGDSLPAEACDSLSYQCQDFLDCELITWLKKEKVQTLTSKTPLNMSTWCKQITLKYNHSKLLILFIFFNLANIFQVAHPSQYVQGYRVFYRTIGNSWLVQNVEDTSDHSTILLDLQSSTEYEVKIRPYFNELQGHDSLMVLLRTPEESKKNLPDILSRAQTNAVMKNSML